MMNRLILMLSLVMLAGCGKKEILSTQELRSAPELNHRRLQELFVVVFEKDFAPEEWKAIFNLTRTLSTNKKLLRTIEGQDTDEAGILRSKLIGENASILTELSAKSLFLMNWSAQDENCKFVFQEECRLICKPRNTDNPLNGGLPVAKEPVQWVVPDPGRSEIKSPYLWIRLSKDSTGVSPSHFVLDLQLKNEQLNESETWLKGEALPALGSEFLRTDGTLSSGFFKFGYAEVTLTK